MAATRTLTAVLLGVLALGDYANGLLSFEPTDAHDPANIDLVRQALTQIGISPDNYKLTQLFSQFWLLGWSYKATLTTTDGRNCYFSFVYKDIVGVSSDAPPICENRYGMRKLNRRKSG